MLLIYGSFFFFAFSFVLKILRSDGGQRRGACKGPCKVEKKKKKERKEKRGAREDEDKWIPLYLYLSLRSTFSDSQCNFSRPDKLRAYNELIRTEFKVELVWLKL